MDAKIHERYEIPINPDFAGQEIDEEGIIPGPVAWLRIMSTVALGNEEESTYYFNGIIKYRKRGFQSHESSPDDASTRQPLGNHQCDKLKRVAILPRKNMMEPGVQADPPKVP